MLEETDISNLCETARTFLQGKRLFRSGAVKQLECYQIDNKENLDLKVQMKAKMDASQENFYKVSLIYNDTENSIENYTCTCPDYHDNNGICKHCVALALEATKNGSISMVLRTLKEVEKMKLQESEGEKQRTTVKRIGKKSTPGFQTILESYHFDETSTDIFNPIEEKVKLYPIYHEEYGSKTGKVEFKIGTTQMYVLRNLQNFCKSIRNKENFSYGKHLEFIHTIEAFDKDSQRMLHFIMARAENNSVNYEDLYNPERYLYLEKEDVTAFFDLMAELNQTMNICRQGKYQESTYQIFFVSGKLQKKEDAKKQEQKVEKLVESLTEMTKNLETYEIQELAKRLVKQQDIELEIDKQNLQKERLQDIITLQGEKEGVTITIEKKLKFLTRGIYPILLYQKNAFVLPENFQKKVGVFFSLLLKQEPKECFISREDLPIFIKKIYPTLNQYFILKEENFLPENYLPQKLSFEIYLDAPRRDMITCSIYAIYQGASTFASKKGQKYNVFDKKQGYAIRDWEEEKIAVKKISSWFQRFDDEKQVMVFEEDEEMLYDFLKQGILEIQTVGEVYVSDAVKRFEIHPSPSITIGISLSGNILTLRLQSEMPLEELAAILSKYDRKRKFIRLKNGQFIDIAHEGMECLYNLKKSLMLTDAQIMEGQAEIPKYCAIYLDQAIKNKEFISVEKNKEFRALVRSMKTVEDSDFEIPDSLYKILRKYQKDGFLWIKTLHENGFGGLLADDMGLGKTIQIIAFLLSEFPKWKDKKSKQEKFALIICPASLIYNWKSEIERFAPELFVITLTGSAEERKEALLQEESKGIYIVSYDLLRRDIEEYKEISFGCQIIDEAQYIKASTTQKAHSVKKIKAGFRLALTGTPVENRLSELWSIFDYLMPGFLYTYRKFRNEIESPIVQKSDKTAMERLQKMIRPFILRRLKKDVLKDLPDKIEENVFSIMEGEQKKLYEAHVQNLRTLLSKQNETQFNKSKLQVFAELTKLRQLCCDPSLLLKGYQAEIAKLAMCMEMIENAVEAGHKILLFSQFTTMLEHLEKALDERNISHFKLIGSISKEKRAKLVEDFNQDDTSVFLISLKAGGTGLNLT